MRYIHFLFFLIIIYIYLPWLNFTKTLSSGDWPYLFTQNIQEFEILRTPLLWLDPYYRLTAKIGVLDLGINWEITEKIFWFIPFLIISIISSYLFSKYIYNKVGTTIFIGNLISALSSLLFLTNTYVLMLAGGGQMGVILAYAFSPLVLLQLLRLIDNASDKFSSKDVIVTGIISALQIMFDPRLFLLVFLIFIIFLIFFPISFKGLLMKIIKRVLIVILIAFVLNLFWVIPNLLNLERMHQVISDMGSPKFFSFADFSNTISLLHPNWPENLFGKVYFMRPEFLLLPILAYLSLFFLRRSNIKNQISKMHIKNQKLNNNITMKKYNNEKIILFFSLLGLTGAFLAKGTNPPFEEIYLWLSNIPGFSAFRDPTKWYLLIVLSYVVLIPYSLYKIWEWLNSNLFNMKISFALPVVVFIIYWFILITPSWQGKLSGTFKPEAVPQEYLIFKDYLDSQKDYFAALWVPEKQRFGFYSFNHPSFIIKDLFNNSKFSISHDFNKEKTKEYLKDKSIKYIVIPYDSKREIFLDDRKYNEDRRKRYKDVFDAIPYLKKLSVEGVTEKITIYEVESTI